MVATLSVDDRVRALLTDEQQLLIAGERVAARSGRTFETVDPSTGKLLARVSEAQEEDVDAAVSSARASFESGIWHTKTSPRDRVKILLSLVTLLEAHADEFALLETLDAGKPITNTRGAEIPIATNYLRGLVTWGDKIMGEVKPISTPNAMAYTVREPVGVCAGIIPWNYPLMMAIWKIGPALAAGNSLVLKPAEQTPLSALRLGELALEAGVPPGVLNVVPGFGETAGAALARHADVDKIAFTGSTAVGQEIVRAAAGNLKRVSLELGGKSPHVIFADGDTERALGDAADGIFYNQGQDCSAGSRVFVQSSIYDDFVNGLADKARALVLGPTLDESTQQGPLITGEHRERVCGFVDGAKADGIEVVTGGAKSSLLGYYYEPTVLGPTSNLARIAQEEVFGPVVVAIPFRDEDDAVLEANRSTFGLAAGLWTRDINRAMRVAKRLRAGRVYINGYGYGDAAAPFGGFRMSGWGRENGREVFDLYTEIKNVWIKWYE